MILVRSIAVKPQNFLFVIPAKAGIHHLLWPYPIA
jgi:hypothetical protein